MLAAGARPNFVKIAALHRAFCRVRGIQVKWTHTGQHHDEAMSEVIIRQLRLPPPDYVLDGGKAASGSRISNMMLAFEPVLEQEHPDWVVVAGDVDSTLACALAARKTGHRLAHVEAGLRSGDNEMPEETNRILTDAVSDKWFVTEQAGIENLLKEGKPAADIHLVGNCMVDTLFHFRKEANDLFHSRFPAKQFVLATFHRPSNVDDPGQLRKILDVLGAISLKIPVIFPLHPRTRASLDALGLAMDLPGLLFTPPMSYLEFIVHLEHAALVITDSGGIQEETTALKTPCITLRNSTERPVTVESGTNRLISEIEPRLILQLTDQAMLGQWKAGKIPDLWDGRAAERIAEILTQHRAKRELLHEKGPYHRHYRTRRRLSRRFFIEKRI